MSKIKINVYIKVSIALLITGTILFAGIIAVGSPYWWIPTIFYSVAAVLAWGSAAYSIWKFHKMPKEGKKEEQRDEGT
jgi:hypothetical protein